jgi:hypothetical protein
VAKRRVPLHLLPFTDPRFRPLAFRSLSKLPASTRERFLRTVHEHQARELYWTWTQANPGRTDAPSVLEKIRKAFDLPPRPRPKPRTKGRTGKSRGRPRTIEVARIRALKRLGRTDAQVAEALGISRASVIRHK